MPFDVATETPAARRARLIEALRAPMPEDFEWDFEEVSRETTCGTVGCAFGLSELIWPDYDGGHEWFGLTEKQSSDIFGVYSWPGSFDAFYGCQKNEVTSAMVADALERITS
jgi:hypothetical protein